MNDLGNNDTEKEFEWSEILHTWTFRGIVTFKRLWWVFLFTLAIAAGVQAYKEHKKVPVYESYAKMIVDGRISISEGANYVEEYSNFYGTQIDLMTSAKVRNRAKEYLAVFHPEYKPSQVSVMVNQSENTSIFNLRAVGLEPVYTQVFLDAVMREYLGFKKERRSQTTESTFLSIMEKVNEYQDQIEDLQQKKLQFQKENNIIFLQEQGSNAGSYLAELNNRQAKLKTDLKLLSQLTQLDANGQLPDVEPILLEAVLGDSEADFLLAKRAVDKLNAERDEFGIYMKPKHPKMIHINREIERQENLLKIIQRQTMRQLKDKKRALTLELNNLNEVVIEWESKALKYSSLLAEFERINSRLENVKSLHDRMSSSIQSIDLNRNLDQETVTILEKASKPVEPREDMWRARIEMGVVGFVTGVGILFIFALLDNRMMSAEDITKRFEAPVLGLIPLQKAKHGGMKLLESHDERVVFAESCRNIRSSLLFMDSQGPPPQCILITSSVPAEGKSTLAANLSITLSFAYSKTLLIDVDLRRGHLFEELGLSNEKGVTELLEDNLEIDDVIQKTHIEGLDFISCGDYPERPGELIMSHRFENVIAELRQRYDYIIFDSPPVLATDDTPSFAKRVDAVLFMVRSNYTRMRQIRVSLEALRLRGSDVKGFILNFVDNREPSYYYNKYNDYYSYPSKRSQGRQKAKQSLNS